MIDHTRPTPLNCYCNLITYVMRPGWPLSTDLACISSLWQPEMKASALKRALRVSPSQRSMSSSAAESN